MSASFGEPIRLDRIHDGMRVDLSASDSERAAIAERLGLARLDRLDAHAALSRDADVVTVRGRLMAVLAQTCVVTGEPIDVRVDEPFDILFTPAPAADAGEEIELGESDCDVVFHDGAAIELGVAVADSLALALDPYPRSAGAEAALKEAGVISEEEAGPFAALAQLKKDLGG